MSDSNSLMCLSDRETALISGGGGFSGSLSASFNIKVTNPEPIQLGELQIEPTDGQNPLFKLIGDILWSSDGR